ncbi:hypothetical protein U1Q18_016322 [Sarracenia purpurea var. burkii]
MRLLSNPDKPISAVTVEIFFYLRTKRRLSSDKTDHRQRKRRDDQGREQRSSGTTARGRTTDLRLRSTDLRRRIFDLQIFVFGEQLNDGRAQSGGCE